MIRPFGLPDVWLLRRLQRSGITLAVEHMLTHPHQPLYTALTAPWPWAGVGVATFVLDENVHGQRLQGFAQLLKRASRAEADLLHVAPAIMSSGEGGNRVADSNNVADGDGAAGNGAGGSFFDRTAEAVWSRLLGHCALAASTHGLQRIYASTPKDCFEQTSLKQAGFCLYACETIYRLASIPNDGSSVPGIRPQHPRDSWSLQRLYARSTPRLVQQAEGALTGEAGSPLLSWWEPNDWTGLVWEPAGEVRGAVQIHRGRAGHWMRILGASELSPREVRLLIEQGLHRLKSRRLDGRGPLAGGASVPVFVTVRDYDMNLSAALTGFGFAPFAERARFVKHTLAAVRAAESAPAAVREMAREVGVHSQSRGLE